MSLLFLASMCFILVPELLKALIFCIVGHSLPVILTMAVEVLGILGGFMILILYIRKKQTQETPGILVCLEGLMPALCAYMAARLVYEFVYPLAAMIIARDLVIGIVIYAVMTMILFIVQGLAFYAFVIRCSGHKGTFRSFIRRIYLGFPAALLVGLVSLVPESVYVELPMNNIAIHFLKYLAAALVMAGLLWLALALLSRMAEKAEQAPSIGLEFRAYNTFFTVGALILLGFGAFRTLYNDPIGEITDTLDSYIYEAELDMVTADLSGAAQQMDRMQSTLVIWKQLAGLEENSELADAYAANTTDTELLYLYALHSGTTEAIEQYLRIYGEEPELALLLLDLYNQNQEIVDLDVMKYRNQYKQAAIIDCIEKGYYTTAWTRPEELQGKILKFAGKLPDYTKYEPVCSVLNLLRENYEQGAVTQELVNEALTLAEQYPEDWMIQYTAAQLGSQLTYDGAGHYEATGEAVMRYVELYITEKDLPSDEAYTVKLSAAQMLIQCYQYEKAISCLKTVLDVDDSGNAYMLLAQCYNNLDLTEECYQSSAEYLKIHSDNSYAMYYGALSALKLGMVDEALQMTSKLAAALETCEDEEVRTYLDFSLYSLLQYISFNDDSNWTDYQYSIYEEMTEEQWKIVNENEFFAKYLNAVYNCFEGDLEMALQLAEEITTQYSQLPNAWYLKGSILYNMQDVTRFEEAVEAYRKAIAIVPEYAAAWYAMANAYDGLEEYELAIEACEHALALLPEQDHGGDWYGISIHCQRLLDSLKSMVD